MLPILPPGKRRRGRYAKGAAVGQHFVGWRERAIGNRLQGLPIVYCYTSGDSDQIDIRRSLPREWQRNLWISAPRLFDSKKPASIWMFPLCSCGDGNE